jgi:hypothetical protein
MSALGQKRTFCDAEAMSALPPIADMCGAVPHVCFGPIADMFGLFDHLVGAGKHGRRNGKAEILGRFEIDDEFKFRRLENRHFCRVGSFENLTDVFSSLAVHPADAWTIAHERTDCRELSNKTYHWQLVPLRKRDNLLTPIGLGRGAVQESYQWNLLLR